MYEKDTRTPLQKQISDLLEQRGWSQSQLSHKAGLGRGAVNDILSRPDRTPRPATLRKIAEALGINPSEIATDGHHDDPEKPLSCDDLRDIDTAGLLSGLSDMIERDPARWRAYEVGQSKARGESGLGVWVVVVRAKVRPSLGDLVYSTPPGGRACAISAPPI